MNALPFSLRQLQYAVAVADTGGFRRAADRCHVSQPSLSAQLGQLETVLGVKLFERGSRGIIPTVSPYLLPDVAPVLRARAPRLIVVWSEEKTGDLLRDLAGGRLDAALLAQGAHMAE